METSNFSLHISLGYGSDRKVQESLNKACHKALTPSTTSGWFLGSTLSVTSASPNNSSSGATPGSSDSANHKLFVASASHVELHADGKGQSTNCVTALVPPSLIDECLEKHLSTAKMHASGSCFWVNDEAASVTLSQHLLSSIHSSLLPCRVLGVVRTSIAAEDNAPAELVFLELPKGLSASQLLNATSGQGLNSNSTTILKVLPLSQIQFVLANTAQAAGEKETTSATSSNPMSPISNWMKPRPKHEPSQNAIPTCAVCLHRIDPVRLGLPEPAKEDLCSKFCTPPNLLAGSRVTSYGSRLLTEEDGCRKQRFLQPWDKGSRCRACQVIAKTWDINTPDDGGRPEPEGSSKANLYCNECAMHKTLWVCLTCGYVGCGRYSNRHSVEHFEQTHHPYSLELATLRIWDYAREDRFAHRVDLLECPCSPPLAYPWITRYSSAANTNRIATSSSLEYPASSEASSFMPNPSYDKSPKKATMIGEEYEALLYSALEDQAQHYEGEITRLRAELTGSLIDQTKLSAEDQAEAEQLKADIVKLRAEVEKASRELLDVQSQEAGHRATSQRLLQEQQEANTILKKIERETRQEAAQGKLQVEDLEQQVNDLTANLKMRQQFSQSEELNKAQIFGTNNVSAPSLSTKRGKKKGRFFRK